MRHGSISKPGLAAIALVPSVARGAKHQACDKCGESEAYFPDLGGGGGGEKGRVLGQADMPAQPLSRWGPPWEHSVRTCRMLSSVGKWGMGRRLLVTAKAGGKKQH